MKRKSLAGGESDSESNGSMDLDLQSDGNETPEEEYFDESDEEERGPEHEEALSAQDEGSVASGVSVDENGPAELPGAFDEDNMSVVSAENGNSVEDESDHDSVSLNSMDTVELENATRKKKEEQEALRNREFSQLYLPVGGIFDHALVQGLPIDEEEYKRQQQAFFNGDTAAERTTTRNTPANVIEALDRELRYSKPPVTVDILVARYNVIKLVIKRRIDHLRAHGHSTPGIRYDNTVYEETESPRIVRTSHSDRLYHDIQFRDPPLTVKEMALQHKVSVAALHAKIYSMRNKGIVTGGIVAATTGRGRPRKVDSNTPYETNTTSTSYTNYTAGHHNTYSNNTTQYTAVDKNSRILKYFTPEEDTKLVNAILQNVERGVRVDWNAMDALLQRSRGAAKQRWLKTLERRVSAEVRMCLSNRLAGLYAGLYKPVQSGNSGSSGGDSGGGSGGSRDGGSVGVGSDVGNTNSTGDNNSTDSDSMDLDTTILKAITARLEVGAVLRAVVGAVQTHSDTFPHATITISPYHNAYAAPTTYYAPQHAVPTNTTSTSNTHTNSNPAATHSTQRAPRPTVTSERSSRNIIPTTAARESYSTHTSRRAFTEADDVLIISTVLEHRRAGVGKFWSALDTQLQRHVMAAKGRWQRVLEPIVNDRIAASKGGSNGSGNDSGGTLWEQYTIESTSKSNVDGIVTDVDGIVGAVVDHIVNVLEASHSTIHNTTSTTNTNTTTTTTTSTTTTSNPFSPTEDALILAKVSEWESSGVFAWAALDTTLNRPPFSALVRYKTALCTAPVLVVQSQTLVPPPFVPASSNGGDGNGNGSNGYVPNSNTNRSSRYTGERARTSYTRLELMLMYNAHWTRTINTTPLVLQQGDEVVVSTVLEHVLTVTVATATASSGADSSAPVRRGNIGRPRLNHHKHTTNATNATNSATNGTAIEGTDNTNNTTNNPTNNTSTEPTNHRLRRFTPEEDAFVEKTIREAKESGKSVSWSALDRALGRSTGAVRQRWKKVLNNEY